MMVHCFSQYDRPEVYEGEVHLDEGKVESGIGQTMEKLVKRFQDAGIRLRAFREAEFEAEQSVPDDYMPMGQMTFVDALQVRKSVEARLYAQKAEAIRKKRENAEAPKLAAEKAAASPKEEKGGGGPPAPSPVEGE